MMKFPSECSTDGGACATRVLARMAGPAFRRWSRPKMCKKMQAPHPALKAKMVVSQWRGRFKTTMGDSRLDRQQCQACFCVVVVLMVGKVEEAFIQGEAVSIL